MILIILVLVCVIMAILSISDNNKTNFWRWLAVSNLFVAINCFLTAQFGLCIIAALAALGMIYLPEYIRKSFR